MGPNFNGVVNKVPHLHAFPHWDWEEGDSVDIWCFSNADSVELKINGKLYEPAVPGPAPSAAKQDMPQFGHVQWSKVPFAKGTSNFANMPGMVILFGRASGILQALTEAQATVNSEAQ